MIVFQDPLEHIKNLHDIVIFGGGASIDLFFNEKPDLNNSIIITCNGSISQIVPHFQCGGDIWAIKHWCKHPNNKPSVIWIAKPKVNEYNEIGIPHINHNDLFEGDYIGTGHEAMSLAYYINHYFDIQNIYYTGFDFSDIILENCSRRRNDIPPKPLDKRHADRIDNMKRNKKYCYPSRGEVMDYQKSMQLPDKWWLQDYLINKCEQTVYLMHLKGIATLIYDKNFKAKLQCRSFLNFNYIDNSHDNGYERAIQHGYYNSFNPPSL